MDFCIRDDDTSFFTSPEDLERAYGRINRLGPVSLAVVPFCRAGSSKGVPERLRGQWSVHPLHENHALVEYLREGAAAGRYEIMLHGYYHDEPDGMREFERGRNLRGKVAHGRKYLEDLIQTSVKVFVPPRNAIGFRGLRAVIHGRLHLGGVAGMKSGWPLYSRRAWAVWLRLREWRRSGGVGTPWVLDLGDHREIAGNAVTPSSTVRQNLAALDAALKVGGVFCAATHYWELDSSSRYPGDPPVGEQLQRLIERATSDPQVVWRSVGDVVSGGQLES